MVQTAQETALPLKTILTYFDIAKNGRFTPLDRCFFDAFLPKICAERPVFTISIPSAEALVFYRVTSNAFGGWPAHHVFHACLNAISTEETMLWGERIAQFRTDERIFLRNAAS